ncbi:hypothetical protein MZK49_22215 [Ensifer sesbaniae]|uniref:hypothetical protein n=1 Tax=Ensifer sesbaniae TaxID=1214071 RepID=UPI002001389E|nr:hypothetical protein [Ensifer sesbaniae]
MVDLVLSQAQIRSAPPEVKEWLRTILLDELALGPEPSARHGEDEISLDECTPKEAGLVLEHIRDDYITCQIFFELGRDTPRDKLEPRRLHRIAIADILRHTRLGDAEHLAASLETIREAFQAVRGEPNAVLFAFDRMGGLYVHNTTWRSIKLLWQALVTSRTPDASELPGMAAPGGPAVPVNLRGTP